MNEPTSNQHANNFDEIGGWIAEAGDPGIEPPSDHVEHVRALLLDRLGPARPRKTPLPVRFAGWLVAACVAIAAGLGVFSVLVRPVNAWARVAQALQEKPWIHIVSRSANAPETESWISPLFQTLAYKYDHGPEHHGAEFHDLKMGTKTQYVVAENTIYRLPESRERQEHSARELMNFEQLLRGHAFQTSPIPDTEILAQKSREITEGGKDWREYELTIRWKEKPERQGVMRWRVDPKTNLPYTCDIELPDGKVHQTIDYPGFGPPDIMALGVPATAKLVDRIPSDDLNRILTGLKTGRNRFDDYCGYVWGTLGVHRVWRKGHRWRVDGGQPRITTTAAMLEFQKIPDGVDLGWWKQREKDFVFDPGAVCDGQTVWYYNYKPQVLDPNQPYSAQLQSVNSHTVYGSSDDPTMPWPHLMPEQLGHPNVYVPDSAREFLLDPKPGDGPPSTVRLRVRNPGLKDPLAPDLYRLWIDPEKNYLSIKSEMAVFEEGAGMAKLAFIDTYTIADSARSPSGFWYPTRVVRKTSNFAREQVTHFALDFQAAIPESLFEHHE